MRAATFLMLLLASCAKAASFQASSGGTIAGITSDGTAITSIMLANGSTITGNASADTIITAPVGGRTELNSSGGNTVVGAGDAGLQVRDHLGNGGFTVTAAGGMVLYDPLTLAGVNTGAAVAVSLDAVGAFAYNPAYITHIVSPYSGTTDDWVSTTGGSLGASMCVETALTNTITAKYNTGNLYTAGGADRPIGGTDRACYSYSVALTRWIEEDQN